MKSLQLVNHSKKGRCVIASEWIRTGALIEVAPVQPLLKPLTWRDPLFDYVFEWKYGNYVEAIAFGVVSLVNHSSAPNASISCNFKNDTIILRAIKEIRPKEEITINPDTASWFQEVAV